MELTYLGHSTFLLKLSTATLLFDPFISPNPAARDINIQELKPDYIMITHGHEDHVTDAEAIAKSCDAKIVSNFEIVSWYGQKGVQGHPMNFGGQWKFKFGNVRSVVAVHSSVMPDGAYGGNPGGFIIDADGKSCYFAGDTALTLDMKLIKDWYPNLDFAVLPVGDNFTMGYEDAAVAAEFIGCDKIIGCHFDTFDVIKIDHEKAKGAFRLRGKELILPSMGESLTF